MIYRQVSKHWQKNASPPTFLPLLVQLIDLSQEVLLELLELVPVSISLPLKLQLHFPDLYQTFPQFDKLLLDHIRHMSHKIVVHFRFFKNLFLVDNFLLLFLFGLLQGALEIILQFIQVHGGLLLHLRREGRERQRR